MNYGGVKMKICKNGVIVDEEIIIEDITEDITENVPPTEKERIEALENAFAEFIASQLEV